MPIHLEQAKKLWAELEDIPVTEWAELENTWVASYSTPAMSHSVPFAAGTSREEIWHWFEETFDLSVMEDLMGLKKTPIHPEDIENMLDRKLVEFTTQFLPKKPVNKDKRDWSIHQWEMFALDYLMANWDHAVEDTISETNTKPVVCDGCGYIIHPGHGVHAFCGLKEWFHKGSIDPDNLEPCWDSHIANCSICPGEYN